MYEHFVYVQMYDFFYLSDIFCNLFLFINFEV